MSDFSRSIATYYDGAYEGEKGELIAEFYGTCEFVNWGYWRDETKTIEEACENLMEELLNFIPEKRGRILDVGCGKGATTRYLTKYFDPDNIIGINISEKQLERCSENAPMCKFLNMNATELDFPDESFDYIISVEAAQHFDTREKFLGEAYRVLKKDGRLVLSEARLRPGSKKQPLANRTRNIHEHELVYRRAGFDPVTVVDATEPCLGGILDSAKRFAEEKLSRGELSQERYRMLLLWYRLLRPRLPAGYYLLIAASKP